MATRKTSNRKTVKTVSTDNHTTKDEATMPKNPIVHTTHDPQPAPIVEQAQLTPVAGPVTPAPLIFLQPPPADAKIPTPPPGAAVPNGANYKVTPTATELAALPGAIADLQKFTTLPQVLGVGSYPYAQVLQAFVVGNQWSNMRKQAKAWDAFAKTQEGICWGTIRAIIGRERPLFESASLGDSTLPVTFPSLATFLGAKKAIAQRANESRRLNRAAIARGELPIHGKAGKKRQKAADKAALAAVKAAPPAPAPVVPAPSPTPAPQAALPPPPAGANGPVHS